jgi:short-subunit dehydrogenase
MIQRILFIGATSSICRQICSNLVKAGDKVYLASRDVEEQTRIAADLKIRYSVEVFEGRFEAQDMDSHEVLANDAWEKLGGIDFVIIASGELGDQIMARKSVAKSWSIIASNYVGPVMLLTRISNFLEKQGHGHITVLTSVAGERGRQSNYIYGSAKGGMIRFLQGLRNRLYQSDVHVLTVQLGFVDTKMTLGKTDMFLVISPEKAGRLIVKAMKKGRNIVYIPAFWSIIMMIIRHIPEEIFKRLKL